MSWRNLLHSGFCRLQDFLWLFHICQIPFFLIFLFYVIRSVQRWRTGLSILFTYRPRPNLIDKHKFTSSHDDSHLTWTLKPQPLAADPFKTIPIEPRYSCKEMKKRLMENEKGWSFLVDERVKKKIFRLFMIRSPPAPPPNKHLMKKILKAFRIRNFTLRLTHEWKKQVDDGENILGRTGWLCRRNGVCEGTVECQSI